MFERKCVITFLGLLLLGVGQSLDGSHVSQEQKVILVTPNLDDDDRDGKPDAADEVINGPLDRKDLTIIEVPTADSKLEPRFSGPGADLSA
jgi:hypothetical protein